MRKEGRLLNQIIIQVVLVTLVMLLFLFATAGKINARGVRRQVLEKQTALLIDSAVPGMVFEIKKENLNGVVSNVEIRNGRVFVSVAGLSSFEGYPYFSRYSVDVEEKENKFVVKVR